MFAEIAVELFSSEILLTTALILLLNIGYTFAYYGIVLLISSMSSRQSACGSLTTVLSRNVQDTSLYHNSLITNSAEIPGAITAIALVERVGRKRTMGILTLLAFVFLHHWLSIITRLLLCTHMFLSAAFSSLGVYAKEVYPTFVRATGSGLGTSVGRKGGIICPLVAVGLVRGCQQTLAVILFGIVTPMSGICVMFFPFETKG